MPDWRYQAEDIFYLTCVKQIRHNQEAMKQRYSVCAAVVALLAVFLFGQPVNAQQLTKPKSLESFVQYMQAHHRAPFDRDSAFIPPEEAAKFMNKPELKLRLNAAILQGTNIK